MSNLKPFDLEKALAGEPVIYRCGTPVAEVLFSKVRKSKGLQCVHSIEDDGSTRTHDVNGVYDKGIKSSFDLFMAPKKIKYYFASWDHDQGRRATTMMYICMGFLEKGIASGAILALSGYTIHEIEIEE